MSSLQQEDSGEVVLACRDATREPFVLLVNHGNRGSQLQVNQQAEPPLHLKE